MAQNIVFLDIDGVLNWEYSKSYVVADNSVTYLGIDNIRVKRLAQIVNATDAKIVLTSTWKKDFVVGAYKQENHVGKYLSNKLRAQGLKIYDTIDKDFRWEERGYAITHWLKHHEHKNWVILDDQSLFFGYDRPEIKEHLIKTIDNWDDESSGLTDYLTQKAIDILNGDAVGPFLDEKFLREWKN